MPGLVPGIHVFGVGVKKVVDGRVKPGHDEKCFRLSRVDTGTLRNFFIIFVDWIFTTLVERPFTNAFDQISEIAFNA
jgi:hypothetical protein